MRILKHIPMARYCQQTSEKASVYAVILYSKHNDCERLWHCKAISEHKTTIMEDNFNIPGSWLHAQGLEIQGLGPMLSYPKDFGGKLELAPSGKALSTSGCARRMKQLLYPPLLLARLSLLHPCSGFSLLAKPLCRRCSVKRPQPNDHCKQVE